MLFSLFGNGIELEKIELLRSPIEVNLVCFWRCLKHGLGVCILLLVVPDRSILVII